MRRRWPDAKSLKGALSPEGLDWQPLETFHPGSLCCRFCFLENEKYVFLNLPLSSWSRSPATCPCEWPRCLRADEEPLGLAELDACSPVRGSKA
jgi:hypothetical protein